MLQRSADPVNVFNIGFPFEREFQYFDRVVDCETQICYEKSDAVGLVQGNELHFLQQTTLELCAAQCSIRQECAGFQVRLYMLTCNYSVWLLGFGSRAVWEDPLAEALDSANVP